MRTIVRDFQRPGRSPVIATHGMAATSHPLSTLAAIDVLEKGGNAVDAAVAACAVQCIVEPGSTGVGGDCFALIAPASGGVIAYNGSGRAPAAATVDWYARHGITAIERQSPHAVTVPGAVDAWAALVEDHGTRDLGELLQPAIRLASEGYAITPRIGFDWGRQTEILRANANARRIYLVDGNAPPVGSIHRQPEMAATLKAIAEHGRDAFYRGPVAADIVECLQALGGLHTMDDFASARGAYVTPIKTRFRDYDVYECPPNGQGVVALIMLNILADCEAKGDPLSAERLHLEIEAARQAYSARNDRVADPDAASVPVDWLLSPAFARELRDRIAPPGISELRPTPVPVEHSDTVYLTVVDKDRNAVSFINSIFSNFGSGIAAPVTGVLLQNRGQGFVLDPTHPNAIAPRKRPMHTIIPGMLMRDGKACMPFGVMGGHYQAMGHAHFLSKIIDYGMDMQSAIDLPRQFVRPGTATVEVESGIPAETAKELARRGFTIVGAEAPIGGAQAIWIDRKNGVLVGASDPRKDGCALGY